MQPSDGVTGPVPIAAELSQSRFSRALPSGTPALSSGIPSRTLVSGLRGGGRLACVARVASLGLRYGLAARTPAAAMPASYASFSTQPPSTTPKPGFAPGTPPPPGQPANPKPSAPPPKPAPPSARPSSGSAAAPPPPPPPDAQASPLFPDPKPEAMKKSRWSVLGWAIPLIGLPLLAVYYNYQLEFDKAWDEKVAQYVQEIAALRQKSQQHKKKPQPPTQAPPDPAAPATQAPPREQPATPSPPLAPIQAPSPPKPAPEPAVEAAPSAPPSPTPSPAPAPAPEPQLPDPAAAPGAAAAPRAPDAPGATDAAAVILAATQAASEAAEAAPAPPSAPAPVTPQAATAATVPPAEAAPKPAAVPPAAPAPSPPPPAPPARGPQAGAASDVAAAEAAALALLTAGGVSSAPLPAGLPAGLMGLEQHDLSPLGLVRHAVTSAGGAVTDWSQWPERYAQAVADSRLVFEALTAAARWHEAKIKEATEALEAERHRAAQLQAEGAGAVERLKGLLRRYTESTKELLEVEVRQAEKRTRLECEKGRITEIRERGEALQQLRLALAALTLAHEARVSQAAAAAGGQALAVGAAAVAAAAEVGAPLRGAAAPLGAGGAAADPLVGAVVGALPEGPVSTRSELLHQFRRLRRDLSALSYLPGEHAGLVAVALARLAARLKADESEATKLLDSEPGGSRGGVDAALARTEALLAAGKPAAAADLLAAALQGTAAAALAADWVEATRRRAAAEAAVAALNAHAAATWAALA